MSDIEWGSAAEWANAAVAAVAAVGTVGALLLTYGLLKHELGLRDEQRQQDERRQAELVTAWFVPGPHAAMADSYEAMHVRNSCDAAVTGVSVHPLGHD